MINEGTKKAQNCLSLMVALGKSCFLVWVLNEATQHLVFKELCYIIQAVTNTNR
jgi:hypothetical protein